jgi:hypothetical protein
MDESDGSNRSVVSERRLIEEIAIKKQKSKDQYPAKKKLEERSSSFCVYSVIRLVLDFLLNIKAALLINHLIIFTN